MHSFPTLTNLRSNQSFYFKFEHIANSRTISRYKCFDKKKRKLEGIGYKKNTPRSYAQKVSTYIDEEK